MYILIDLFTGYTFQEAEFVIQATVLLVAACLPSFI